MIVCHHCVAFRVYKHEQHGNDSLFKYLEELRIEELRELPEANVRGESAPGRVPWLL